MIRNSSSLSELGGLPEALVRKDVKALLAQWNKSQDDEGHERQQTIQKADAIHDGRRGPRSGVRDA